MVLQFVLVCTLLTSCSAALCSSNASRIESLFVLDSTNYRIRVVSPLDGYVSTLAGSGVSGVVDGNGKSASFQGPGNSAMSRDGSTLYVSDGPCVRSVNLMTGFYSVKTVVGNCLAGGNVVGSPSVARLSAPLLLASDVGDKGLFIADTSNRRIKYFDFQTNTLRNLIGTGSDGCGQTGIGTSVSIYGPTGLHVSSGGDYMIFSQTGFNMLYFVNLSTVSVRPFAGTCGYGSIVDGVGTSAFFKGTSSMIGSSDGSKIYLADGYNTYLRVVTYPGAVVTTLRYSAGSFAGFVTLTMDALFVYTVCSTPFIRKINTGTGALVATLGVARGYADGNIGGAYFGSLGSVVDGYIYNFSTCARCTAGEYQNVSVQTSLVCVKCPAGTYGSSVDSSACQACAQGKYSSAIGLLLSSSCQNCQAGSYASLTGLSACTTCTPGSYSTGVGMSTSLCVTCVQGYHASSAGASACVYCYPGKYASQSAASTCLYCAAGTFAFSTASWNCQACYVGYYSQYQGAASCQRCSTGTFNPSTGMSACQSCGLGTYIFMQGVTACTSCLPGTYASSEGFVACQGCSAGTFASASAASVCTLCSAGGYCPASSATPTNCASGTYGTVFGAVSAVDCVGCAAGTYCPSGSTAAANCSSGTFSGSGSGVCTACPAFSFSAEQSAACVCDAGHYISVVSGAVAVSDTYMSDITSMWPSMGLGFPSYPTISGKMNMVVAVGSSVLFALQPYANAIVGLSLLSSLFELNQEMIQDSNGPTVYEHISVTSSFSTSQQFLYSVGVSGQSSAALAWDTSNVPSGIYYLMLTAGQSDKRYAVEVFAAALAPTTLTYYLNASFMGQLTPTAACIGDTLVLDKVSSIATASISVVCFPRGTTSSSDLVFKVQGVAPLSWTVDSGMDATQCVITMAPNYSFNRVVSVISVYARPTGNTVLPVSWSSFSCPSCSAGSYSPSGVSVCSKCAAGFTSQAGSSTCIAVPCSVGYYGVGPLCSPCPANTNSSGGFNLTVLDCRCLAGFVCTYTKQINVVLTLNSITWDMTTIAGLSQNAIIDAIAQAAGVPREKVVISSIFSGRRLLRLQRREVHVTVHGAEGLDIDSVYRQLNVSHVAWTHRHSVHVARELI
jgi:hypothetical protein